MRKAATSILAGALLILGTGLAARAQSSSPPSAPRALEQEVLKLNGSLQELIALLREYLARQDVDLLLKRVEIGLQKIGPLDQELRSLREKKAADAEELSQLRTAMTALQALEPQDRTDSENPTDAVRKIQMEGEIKRLGRRISDTEQRIIETENALVQEQQSLQQWEMEIDKRLRPR